MTTSSNTSSRITNMMASCLLLLPTAHAFVMPSQSAIRTSNMVLHQAPDQFGGWMQEGSQGVALTGEPMPGNPQTGTYSRDRAPPHIDTSPSQPLARTGSAADYYYPPKQGVSSEDWWTGAGSPGQPLFGGPSSANAYYPRTSQMEEPQAETIQGAGSRKTWDTSQHDQTNFVLGSVGGRPVYANVQVWEGPNNTPASMSLYSEDGNLRPWSAGFQNTLRSGGSSVLNIRNTGPMEFPVQASVEGSYDGTRGQLIGDQIQQAEKQQQQATFSPSKNLAKSKTIQGETLKTFSVGPECQAIRVELYSEGRPMYAKVEMWQGPSNIQQCAEIYSDNGNDRVWSAVIPTPGYACTVAIRNVGPMAYPISASVDAMS
ncbi:expressed unknown protein [Seminavis robusta]|uniref:Uncharacterized protein n=1 Tax=Seminavis robusta TaxID=568900 RepID=A0A9N8HD19_9STRA|nr:expressed unknown protein [Seminavis robusta]|eukprot:Sro405_g136290.1 n/a (373) ;mRNA; r:63863-64981